MSYPRPAGFEVEEHNFGGCFGSTRSQSPSICGLVVCSTGLAEPTSAGCTCRGPGGASVARTSLCQRIRCADGNLPDPQSCACDEPIGTLPEPGSPLASTWPLSVTPLTLDACAAGTPAVYDYARDPRSIVSRDGVAMWDR